MEALRVTTSLAVPALHVRRQRSGEGGIFAQRVEGDFNFRPYYEDALGWVSFCALTVEFIWFCYSVVSVTAFVKGLRLIQQ